MQNIDEPPADRSLGWKPWGDEERWWMGTQWSETTRERPDPERKPGVSIRIEVDDPDSGFRGYRDHFASPELVAELRAILDRVGVPIN